MSMLLKQPVAWKWQRNLQNRVVKVRHVVGRQCSISHRALCKCCISCVKLLECHTHLFSLQMQKKLQTESKSCGKNSFPGHLWGWGLQASQNKISMVTLSQEKWWNIPVSRYKEKRRPGSSGNQWKRAGRRLWIFTRTSRKFNWKNKKCSNTQFHHKWVSQWWKLHRW